MTRMYMKVKTSKDNYKLKSDIWIYIEVEKVIYKGHSYNQQCNLLYYFVFFLSNLIH